MAAPESGAAGRVRLRGPGIVLLFAGTLLTAAGYGSTFLLTDHFRALGGSEIEVGHVLGGAVVGTLIGVPAVGWLGARFGGARLAGVGSLLLALGYFMLASLTSLSPLIAVAGLLIGLGWGTFYLAAPIAVSERVTDEDRGFWFTRFGAFQMAGIGGGPMLALLLADTLQVSPSSIFRFVASGCCIAAACLWTFDRVLPRPYAAGNRGQAEATQSANWIRSLGAIGRTRARYPIVMVGLGACVFTGIMTFQSSLVRDSGLNAGVYFTTYAIVVVAARFFLAATMARADGDKTSIVLLILMTAGVLAMFAIGLGLAIQLASAILLALGYGLVYTIIQTQAVNDAPERHRNGALTWFVISYFLGIFGFPAIGGWILASAGKTTFLVVVLACATLELLIAEIRRRDTKGSASL